MVHLKEKKLLLRTILKEILLGAIVAFVVICALTYLKVLSFPDILSYLAFLSSKEKEYKNVSTKVIYNDNNFPKPKAPVWMTLDSNENPEVDPSVITLDFVTDIIDVSSNRIAGKDVYKLKIKAGEDEVEYLYSGPDLLKVEIFEKKNSVKNQIKFSDLRTGDKIAMHYTANFTKKDLISLTITKIPNAPIIIF